MTQVSGLRTGIRRLRGTSLALALAVLTGCSVAHQTHETTHNEFLYWWSNRHIEKQMEEWAEEAFFSHCAAGPGTIHDDHLQCGFEAGFVHYLKTGKPCDTYILPPEYLKAKYVSPEGKQAIDLWIEGYALGTIAAEQSGYRELVKIPVVGAGIIPAERLPTPDTVCCENVLHPPVLIDGVGPQGPHGPHGFPVPDLPGTTVPEFPGPQEPQPVPEAVTPEAVPPQPTPPAAVSPEVSLPEDFRPEAFRADEPRSQAVRPEAATLEFSNPESSTPETTVPETVSPESAQPISTAFLRDDGIDTSFSTATKQTAAETAPVHASGDNSFGGHRPAVDYAWQPLRTNGASNRNAAQQVDPPLSDVEMVLDAIESAEGSKAGGRGRVRPVSSSMESDLLIGIPLPTHVEAAPRSEQPAADSRTGLRTSQHQKVSPARPSTRALLEPLDEQAAAAGDDIRQIEWSSPAAGGRGVSTAAGSTAAGSTAPGHPLDTPEMIPLNTLIWRSTNDSQPQQATSQAAPAVPTNTSSDWKAAHP